MSKKTKSTNEQTPWAPAVPLLQDVITRTQELGPDGFRVDPYEDQRVADLSPETLAGMQGLSQGSAVTPMAMDAFSGFLNNDTQSRAFDQMKATTLADTKAALGSTLAGGGLNTGLGMQSFGRGMADAVGGLEYGAWNDAQNRKMQALGMAPQMQGLGTTDANNQLRAGGIRGAHNQANIDADMARYYEDQTADQNALSQYANLSAMMGGMGGTERSTRTDPWSMEDTGSFLGSIAGFFSDRRLKENISKIGETKGGTNVYSYNYIGGVQRHIGPMSDEVPHAIVGQINGFDVVDYGSVV